VLVFCQADCDLINAISLMRSVSDNGEALLLAAGDGQLQDVKRLLASGQVDKDYEDHNVRIR
jgi:hypothetical protein